MLLFYDGQCSLCRTLAQRIHFESDKEVGIHPLSSSKAQKVLDTHYPEGWEHDFYVVDDNWCRKGARALPRLTKAVGFGTMMSMLAEYGRTKLAPKAQTCVSNGNGQADASKRNFLKAAALAPVMLGLSKMSRHDLTDHPMEGFQIHVAEVEDLGAGEFRVDTYACPQCQRSAEPMRDVPQGASAHLIERETLADGVLREMVTTGQSAPRFVSQKIRYEKQIPSNGSVRKQVVQVHGGMVDHPEFQLAVNLGQGGAIGLAGMARHHLPLPVLDQVVLKTTGTDARTHLRALQEGVRGLLGLHEENGLTSLAAVYRQVLAALEVLPARFDDGVLQEILPSRNQLVLTSMPEMLRFAGMPATVRDFQMATASQVVVDEEPCDCSCSCSACCGCGCTLGICVGPLPCDCDCCLGCGCGCGCCV